MAHLIPYVIGMLLMIMTAICGVRSTALTQLSDEHNYNNNNCSWIVIKNSAVKDITIVNAKNNDFVKDIHSLRVKTLMRTFFATHLQEPNQAYVVQCDDLRECEKGFSDLVKDRYWNPNAIFIVTIRNFSYGKEDFFQKLHHLYVFKTVVVAHARLHFYDFHIGEHCRFTASAIKDYECDSLALGQDSLTWAHIKGSLEGEYKTPYAECNMSVIVRTTEPFIFHSLDDKDEPFGYEEEFIRILKRINFTRILYSYSNGTNEYSGTGVVCENFTVSGILKNLQDGVVDYVLGGTLLSRYRLQVFDFTYPHWCDNLLFIVPKARHIGKWEVMYTVFQPLVWGLILLALAFVSLVAFILPINGKRNLHQFVLTTLDLYGYFTNNASKKSTTYFMLSWALFTWLITCFYQCDLSSIFTRPTYYKDVNTLQEILKHNYKFYLHTPLYNFMKGNEELDMGGLVQNSALCKTSYDCLKSVAYKRKRFTLQSRLAYLYLEAAFYKEDGEAMLYRAEAYTHIFMTGYLRKGNPNLKRIRALEHQVIAFGFHRRSLLAYIHMNKLKYHKFKKNISEPLSCLDIAGVYYIYLCGCGISLVTFFIEVAPSLPSTHIWVRVYFNGLFHVFV